MVYWIEPLTLDQRVAGSIPVNVWHFLSFSKTLYPHCCSPPRCINGYDANVICCMVWYVCTPEVAPGQNAPQGVEKVHYECRIDIESSDRGNNTL